MKLLAAVDQGIQDLFGGITPPEAMNVGGSGTAQQGIGNIISFGIQMFILIAGVFLLLYLLWGAFDWITSGGEKEKITKAQGKITNAVIGMLLIFVVLAVFIAFAGNSLGIIRKNDITGGFDIILPTLGQ